MHAKEYAQALFSLRTKPSGEQSLLVKNLIALLKSRGHEKLLPKIVSEYERISEGRSQGGIQVRVADEKSRKDALHKADALAREYGIDQGAIRVSEDENLIRGYSIEGPGFRHDASARGSLLALHRHLKAN